ncbi:hypothetical protein OIU77_003756 [Salix suchowensis]|uniref:PsbP C-terminal domain-containing protein n=1 Tax=Salix suchowensis TaxID=1278906 RepID=A0ABQ9AS97_9ROSI|nr:hypothetical protein OIU77_003756 [Salix suchowensis]
MSRAHREMARILDSFAPPAQLTHPNRSRSTWFSLPMPISPNSTCCSSIPHSKQLTKAFAVRRRDAMALILSSYIFSEAGFDNIAFAQQSVGFREYIDQFDGYSLKYPQNWIQVRGAGADIFFRDPFVLDENVSVELSSPIIVKLQEC